MAFKEYRSDDVAAYVDASVSSLLEMLEAALADDKPSENVEETPTVDPTSDTLGNKARTLVHKTLDQLLSGDIVLENAQELIATIQAVRDVQTVGN